MRRGLLFCGLLAVCFLVISTDAVAEDRWNLDFKQVKMGRVLVKFGETATPYWYLVYKVTNPTDDSITLNLQIKAHSDVGKKSYIEWYSPAAVKAVAAKEGRPLKNVQEMRGDIGPGESFEAVALFRNVHEGTDNLKIEVMGLWDRVTYSKGKLVVEDRVLNLYFFRPGDEYFPQFDRFFFKKSEWVVL